MKKYTDEQKRFVREISSGRYIDEITLLFNARFGTDVTQSQMKSFKSNYGIRSDVPKRRINENEGLFTKEQKEFIKKHVTGLLTRELTDLVNSTFNLSVTLKQMHAYKKNHKLTSGLNTTFRKGQDPANKGTKGLYNIGGNRTSFKKGQIPHNYKPVGSERIDKNGYLLIKISDEGPWQKRWKHKHKIIWEEANGPIPDGHKLLFADQDKSNLTLDNLILVSNSQLVILNKNGLLTKNKEFNKTGIIMADLHQKINERSKD